MDFNAHDRKDKEAMEKVIKDFSDIVNNMCCDKSKIAEAFALKFVNTHRTLQQGMIKTLAIAFKVISKKYPQCDPRNEQAMEWIKEVTKIEKHFPLI